uniref:MARVEL domain-containing protein n=1 Tax=Syphacia muris TaxID=451379 RepID=A0A0N5AAA0_9BILA
MFRSYSGPTKNSRNLPLYRKKKEPNGPASMGRSYYYGSEGNGLGTGSAYPATVAFNENTVPTLRRIRPYYSPSYTTYPPSIMHPSRKHSKSQESKYPLTLRIIVKAAELCLGAAILGLVLGPMRHYSFHDFVTMTKTEWQGFVVGIVSCFSALALFLLLTSCIAYRQLFWKKIDYFVSIVGLFCYLLTGFVEAYFAACYPPNGAKINLVCHRAEWIIATVCLLSIFYISSIKNTVTVLLLFRKFY